MCDCKPGATTNERSSRAADQADRTANIARKAGFVNFVCQSVMTKSDRHTAVCLVQLAASLAAGFKPLVGTFRVAWQSDMYTHILLVMPVSAALIAWERRRLRKMQKWNLRLGPVILVVGMAIVFCEQLRFFWLSSDERLAIQMFALVLAWIGIAVVCFGSQTCRAMLFPLLFLFGLVPIPEAAVNIIISLLQEWSAWSAHALFALFNVPISQQGVQLTVPGLTIEVARECSSIRSTSVLILTAPVLAYVLLRSPWRRVLIIFLAIPLSIAKNGLRIFTIVMLGTKVDSGYLTGKLHQEGGILFFVLTLMVEFAVLLLLRRGEAMPAGMRLSYVHSVGA